VTNIAWKNLAGDWTRLVISVAGVAFSVVLVLTLRGLLRGVIDEATAYVRTAGADLWVAQAGIPPDFIQATSVLPSVAQADVRVVPGVASVAPLLNRSVAFVSGAKEGDLFLVGADPRTTVGWPARVGRSIPVPQPGQVVVDRVFARHFGFSAGDVLRVGERDLVISAVTGGGNAFAYQLGWANLSDVADLLDARAVVSYLLVEVAEGLGPGEVAERIEQEVPGTQVFTTAELADRNAENLREGFIPVLWVLMTVAFVVGTAVIGLIIYTATIEKQREYGILKAIGFSNRRLYRIVMQQSVIAGAGGLVVGCLLSLALGPAIERVVPVFVTDIRLPDIVFVGTGALVMSLVASLLPARPVARLDPAEVFKR
jgi:putative ABC transport system permease protein